MAKLDDETRQIIKGCSAATAGCLLMMIAFFSGIAIVVLAIGFAIERIIGHG